MKLIRAHKKLFIGVLAAVLAMAALFTVLGAGSSASVDESNAIREAIIGAEEMRLSIGAFTSADGYSSSLTEEELAQLVEDYNTKADNYYAEGNPCRELYKELNQDYLTRVFQTRMEYTVSSGVQELQINSIQLDEEGNQATVDCVATTWATWVVERDGHIEVDSPVNQATMTLAMVKEDGQWKVLEVLDLQVQFKPEETEEAQAYSAAEANDSELVLQQDFTTFEEALAAAESIDIDELNHF